MPGIGLPQAGIRPTNATPEFSSSLASDDVDTGTILWLGSYEETLASFVRRTGFKREPVTIVPTGIPMDHRAYNHPVVVSQKYQNSISFYIITSRGGLTTLDSRFDVYIPVIPTEAQPESPWPVLKFLDDKVMEKPGWIDLGIKYSMDWRDAQFYWANGKGARTKWRLDVESRWLIQDYAGHLQRLGIKSPLSSRRASERREVRPVLALEPGTQLAWRQPETGTAGPATRSNTLSLPGAPLLDVGRSASEGKQPDSGYAVVRQDSETTKLKSQALEWRPLQSRLPPAPRSLVMTGPMGWRVNTLSAVSPEGERDLLPDWQEEGRHWRGQRVAAYHRLHRPLRWENHEAK